MAKIYLLAVLCMVSAAASLLLDDKLPPRPILPPGSENIITPKPNGLKPIVQDSKESEAEAPKEQPQPNKVHALNVNGEESKGNKDSKEPQKGENSKELNKPDDIKESGEDKKKGPSSEELDKDHGNIGEKRPEKPIPMKNPSILMSYLNWLLGQSLLGSRSDYHDQQPSISIIALPDHDDLQESLY